MANEKDEILDHNYDGIQEYDNDLPRWWVNIFWITAIFSVGYVIFRHTSLFESFGIPVTQHGKWEEEVGAIKALRAASEANTGAPDASRLLAFAKDQGKLTAGKTVFEARCMQCHLQQGQGLVGPNLTDDYWIHGGKITDIRNVVVNGVLEKGMVAWKDVLSADEIDAVTAYVWSLHGTNPPNPKDPQGELVQRTE